MPIQLVNDEIPKGYKPASVSKSRIVLADPVDVLGRQTASKLIADTSMGAAPAPVNPVPVPERQSFLESPHVFAAPLLPAGPFPGVDPIAAIRADQEKRMEGLKRPIGVTGSRKPEDEYSVTQEIGRQFKGGLADVDAARGLGVAGAGKFIEGMGKPSYPMTEGESFVIPGLNKVTGPIGNMIKLAGEKHADKWGKVQDEYKQSADIAGNVIDNPGLLVNPKWWASNAARMTPGMGAALLTAVATGGLSGLAAGGAIGGLTEGQSTRKQALESGKSPDEALDAGVKMALASGILNSLGLEKMLNPAGRNALMRFMLSGGTEMTTEMAEEPAEGVILGEDWNVFKQRLKNMATVAPIAFAMGGPVGVMSGRGKNAIGTNIPETATAPATPPAEMREPGQKVFTAEETNLPPAVQQNTVLMDGNIIDADTGEFVRTATPEEVQGKARPGVPFNRRQHAVAPEEVEAELLGEGTPQKRFIDVPETAVETPKQAGAAIVSPQGEIVPQEARSEAVTPKEAKRYYHGTSSKDFTEFGDNYTYLTDRQDEAKAFSENPIIGGGRGKGKPRVLDVTAKPGPVKDIDSEIQNGIMEGIDPDDVIKEMMPKLKDEGIRYVEFNHPSTTTGEDFKATVSLYPKEDLAITPPTQKGASDAQGQEAPETLQVELKENHLEKESFRSLSGKYDEVQKRIDTRYDELKQQGISVDQADGYQPDGFPDLNKMDVKLQELYAERNQYGDAANRKSVKDARKIVQDVLGDDTALESPYSSIDDLLSSGYRLSDSPVGAAMMSETAKATQNPETIKKLTTKIASLILAKENPSADFWATMDSNLSGLTKEGKKDILLRAKAKAEEINSKLKDFLSQQPPIGETQSAETPTGETQKTLPHGIDASTDAYVRKQVQARGSLDEALSLYSGKSDVDKYGRQVAQEVYGKGEEKKAKEPWEMTKKEYKNSGNELSEAYHRNGIVNAIREGRPVPASVLAEYPDLKPATNEGLKVGDLVKWNNDTSGRVDRVTKIVNAPFGGGLEYMTEETNPPKGEKPRTGQQFYDRTGEYAESHPGTRKGLVKVTGNDLKPTTTPKQTEQGPVEVPDYAALYDEAQSLIRKLPSNVGKAKQEGKLSKPQLEHIARLDEIEKIMPSTSPEWKAQHERGRANWERDNAAQIKATSDAETQKMREKGYELGDKVSFFVPPLFPGAPMTHYEGTVSQNKSGQVVVKARNKMSPNAGTKNLDLFRNPWKKIEAAKEPGATSHDEQRYAEIRKINAKQFKTAGDEKRINLLRGEIAAKPEKWKPGEGVGYYAGPATSTKRGSQINRGFRIQEIDVENKKALIGQVADTGLTSTGGNNDIIKPQWMHIADLVRDKKYDGKAKEPAPVEIPVAKETEKPVTESDRLIDSDLTTAITDLTDVDTGKVIPAGTEHYALKDGTNLSVESYRKAKGEPEIVVSGEKNKTVETVMPKADEKKVTLKEQKDYLLKEIDAVIDRMATNFGNVHGGKREDLISNVGKGSWGDVTEEGTTTILVPGDGEYKLTNSLKSFLEFKSRVKNEFPSDVKDITYQPTKVKKVVHRGKATVNQVELDKAMKDMEEDTSAADWEQFKVDRAQEKIGEMQRDIDTTDRKTRYGAVDDYVTQKYKGEKGRVNEGKYAWEYFHARHKKTEYGWQDIIEISRKDMPPTRGISPERIKEIQDDIDRFYKPENKPSFDDFIKTKKVYVSDYNIKEYADWKRITKEELSKLRDEYISKYGYGVKPESPSPSAPVKPAPSATLKEDIEYPFMSRPASPSPSISGPEVMRAVDDIASEFNVPVKVVATAAQLPEAIRDAALRKQTGGDVVLGIYHNGKVYVVAEHIRSRMEAQKVFIHEAAGHYGLRKVMGKEFEDFLDFLNSDAKYGKDIKAFAEENEIDDMRVAADEWFAQQSESVKPGTLLWNRFVMAVKKFLARLGVKWQFSNAELMDILRRAREAAKVGGEIEDVTRYSTRKQTVPQSVYDDAVKAGKSQGGRVYHSGPRGSVMARVLVPISTRLASINPVLRAAFRNYRYLLNTTLQSDIESAKPLMQATKSMSNEDQIIFDLARKNGDAGMLQHLIIKYRMGKEYAKLRNMLDAIHERAKNVGYDIGYRGHYHPRVIKDPSGFLEYLYNTDAWGDISEAIKQKEADIQRPLSDIEKAHIANNMIRGYGKHITLSAPGNIKERQVELIDAELNRFYYDSNEALMIYLANVNKAIESRKFFGKSEEIKKILESGRKYRNKTAKENISAFIEKIKQKRELLKAKQKVALAEWTKANTPAKVDDSETNDAIDGYRDALKQERNERAELIRAQHESILNDPFIPKEDRARIKRESGEILKNELAQLDAELKAKLDAVLPTGNQTPSPLSPDEYISKRTAFIEQQKKDMEVFDTQSQKDLVTYRSNARSDAITMKVSEQDLKDSDPELDFNMESNIGDYVAGLIGEGKIKPGQEGELIGIFQDFFNYRSTSGVLDVYKNIGYMTTMGNVFSTITQFGDLAFAWYNAGLIRSSVAFGRAAVGKSNITRHDIGIERIAEEFTNPTRMGHALEKIFKVTGFNFIDRLGKETLINATIAKLQAQAKRNDPALVRKLNIMLTGNVKETIEDLKEGRIEENVKLVAFNTLLDFQPVDQMEMPQTYLAHPGGRVFYMLKTYTIKMFDVFRREAFAKIKEGNIVEGIGNLTRLSAIMVLCNASADEIKDFIAGRDRKLTDRIVDNILRLFGFSRYVLWQFRTQPVQYSLYKMVAPPLDFVEMPARDMKHILSSYKKNKDIELGLERGKPEDFNFWQMESWKQIPFGGANFYWWFGGGHEKVLSQRYTIPMRDSNNRILSDSEYKKAKEALVEAVASGRLTYKQGYERLIAIHRNQRKVKMRAYKEREQKGYLERMAK
jgi:hypothetical protein